ncbi:hypothetical protein ACLH2L_09885 [Klebsiella grimontii]|uniref:hypothetical protein n=1 Tax=Klebsiella grimontii TaxID=2058152 RepID=UPI003983D76D
MGKIDCKYQVVYRNEGVECFISGSWVFFQRPKECGGGYWLGRTFDNVFMLELEYPVSLHEGIIFLNQLTEVADKFMDFDDDFQLT